MSQNKEAIISFLNHYLALSTLVGGAILVIFILYSTYRINTKTHSKFLSTICTFAIPLSFFIALAGALMSLYYSEYLGILPCDLCWFQRIFMYSQVVLFAVAWWKKDKNIFTYTLALSVIGLIIALYHHIMQLGYDVYKPCSTAPFAVDCAKPTFVEYGFVTFPLMAVVLFVALILLAVIAKKK